MAAGKDDVQGGLISQVTDLSLQETCSTPLPNAQEPAMFFLPEETLIAIFDIAIRLNDSLHICAASPSNTIDARPYAFVLAQVCAYWRQLVVSTSSLWSLISYRARTWRPELVNPQIERSGPYPLDVVFIASTIEEESDMDEEVSVANAFVSLVSPLVARFRVVHFDVHDHRSFESILHLLGRNDAPLSKDLGVFVSTAPPAFDVSSHMQMDWEDTEATAKCMGLTHPLLRSISLQDLYLPSFPMHMLVNVTRVELNFTGSQSHSHQYEPKLVHLLQFLNATPRLEDLILECGSKFKCLSPSTLSDSFGLPGRVELPNLRNFTWTNALPYSVKSVMNSLSTPRLESWKLSIRVRQNTATMNVSVRVLIPSLKELYVECVDREGLETAFGRLGLPSVERFEVVYVPLSKPKSKLSIQPAPPVFPYISGLFVAPCLQNLTHLSVCGFAIPKSYVPGGIGEFELMYMPSLRCLSFIECTGAAPFLGQLAAPNESIKVGVNVCPRLREVTIVGCADVDREDVEELLRSRSQRCQREEIQKIVQTKGDAQEALLLGRKIVPLRRPKRAGPGAATHGAPTPPAGVSNAEAPSYEAFIPAQLERLHIEDCELVTEGDATTLEDMDYGTMNFYW
ncbi:hypothetical protein CONPUDRAFT_146915 [Coniophora puteana RWD-64-598 SS2]|uniref:F-box domain-containing protein n=1 Tax=Coniophora puteana (strain RWD-64-598) TaxID=741705 RepID=A0A5M3M9D8_CONPW|nr:uncharacterized protein CONPUDRAFT_146915 [Coniophora puteana RWD-64-598 SS2]EIW75779.1 hypothetical protein CONPUDRAFT_146915 [Coniophora puteana RWD-64-598 SS2]